MQARLFGHPIHPMLIAFPVGLLPTAAIFDIVYLFTHNAPWGEVSFWTISVGLLGALAAAIFGLIDWIGIPFGTRAKSVGLIHGLTNVVVVVFFVVSWVLRRPNPAIPPIAAIILCFIGVVIAVFGVWLGGELVYRLGIAVDEGAHTNAPNSLSDRPASERANL